MKISTKQWKTTNTNTTGTSSLIEGPTNTANMNDASHPAAYFCTGLTVGGYTDWYMPATNELEVCYYNLKPTTGANWTSGTNGQNPNAVPARASNYTSGVPAQTSATAFQTGQSQSLVSEYYFASTQRDSMSSWLQSMSMGYQRYNLVKTSPYRVRAVRRLAV
jgi:hypothetical protein